MEKLIHQARELFNVHLIGRQVLALGAYEKELLEWNQKFNLTAIRDVDGIRTKHFLDSFSCVLAWKENPQFPVAVSSTVEHSVGRRPSRLLGKALQHCQSISDELCEVGLISLNNEQ